MSHAKMSSQNTHQQNETWSNEKVKTFLSLLAKADCRHSKWFEDLDPIYGEQSASNNQASSVDMAPISTCSSLASENETIPPELETVDPSQIQTPGPFEIQTPGSSETPDSFETTDSLETTDSFEITGSSETPGSSETGGSLAAPGPSRSKSPGAPLISSSPKLQLHPSKGKRKLNEAAAMSRLLDERRKWHDELMEQMKRDFEKERERERIALERQKKHNEAFLEVMRDLVRVIEAKNK